MAKQKTRADLEQIIVQGGSVRYQGRIIRRVQDLPTEADLAEGSPERQAAALADIDAKIAALEAQKARLQAGLEAVPEARGGGTGKADAPPATKGKATS